MWLISFKTDTATFQRVPAGAHPTGEDFKLGDARCEAFESFECALKMFNVRLKIAYDMEEGRTLPRQPDPIVLGMPGQKVWVVERAPLWCVVSDEVVAENGKVLVNRFGVFTELDLNADKPKDMGYDGVFGWAYSNVEVARELKREMDYSRWS